MSLGVHQAREPLQACMHWMHQIHRDYWDRLQRWQVELEDRRSNGVNRAHHVKATVVCNGHSKQQQVPSMVPLARNPPKIPPVLPRTTTIFVPRILGAYLSIIQADAHPAASIRHRSDYRHHHCIHSHIQPRLHHQPTHRMTPYRVH